MYRKIELNYSLNDDKSILTIEMQEETTNSCQGLVKEYNLLEFDDNTILYNQTLDDFDAEYDELLANLLEKLIDKVLKENE